VHITPCRYAGPLQNPAALLRGLAATEFQLDIDVSDLLIIKEHVFPSLNYQLLRRITLAHGARPRQTLIDCRRR
jgi:hypothetical protein